MNISRSINSSDDLISTSEVEDRIAWLEVGEEDLDEDDVEELTELRVLYEQVGAVVETLINDAYFEEYAQRLAEDIGAINDSMQWPSSCIDWERAAHELQHDYSSVEFDGVTFWYQ